jgi:hypothetical protein
VSPAARSVNIFGAYLLTLGVLLLIAPNLLLTAFGLPPTAEVWIRVVGMLVAYLGIYYRVAAAANVTQFFLATILLRTGVPLFFLTFVLAGWAEWPLVLFGAVDAAGAAWTWTTLRAHGAGA